MIITLRSRKYYQEQERKLSSLFVDIHAKERKFDKRYYPPILHN